MQISGNVGLRGGSGKASSLLGFRGAVVDGIWEARLGGHWEARYVGVADELEDGISALEVRGTRFTVKADATHTRRVVVTEGVVALSFVGKGAILVRAGEQWPNESDAGSKVTGVVGRSEPLEMDASTPLDSAGAGAGAKSTDADGSIQLLPRQNHKVDAERSAGKDFSVAMDAFESGRYSKAVSQCASFLRNHPADARCEDATFLCAVARARLGDRAGASRWVKRYLATYPRGLRGREARKLAGLSDDVSGRSR